MSTDRSTITVLDLTVHIVRKPIENIHLAVYPPDGAVRIAVPKHVDDEAVRLAVIERLGWIRQGQRELQNQPRQTARDMVTGESHYVWGRRYLLKVVYDNAAANDVRISNGNRLQLTVREDANRDRRMSVLTEWYRDQVKEAVPAIIDAWHDQLAVEVLDWRIKKMKTKWGSCNEEAGRIWLNLNLAKKPRKCLEYVVVHELLHLRESPHSARFEQLLDRAMPDWRQRREELYALPLSHEDWVSVGDAPIQTG